MKPFHFSRGFSHASSAVPMATRTPNWVNVKSLRMSFSPALAATIALAMIRAPFKTMETVAYTRLMNFQFLMYRSMVLVRSCLIGDIDLFPLVLPGIGVHRLVSNRLLSNGVSADVLPRRYVR